jgi:hypothetical protein
VTGLKDKFGEDACTDNVTAMHQAGLSVNPVVEGAKQGARVLLHGAVSSHDVVVVEGDAKAAMVLCICTDDEGS